jgi:hypothetical protein
MASRLLILTLALACVVTAADARAAATPGFVVHFDCLRNEADARALVQVAAAQGAGVISVVPPAHVWENPTALRMLTAVVGDAGRLHLQIIFARIDAAYPPDSSGRRENYLYGRILSEPGRLPDGRATVEYFLTTAGRRGYTEWMEEETRYYAAHYGRLSNLIGFTVGPFVEPFASERGGFLQYDDRTDRYELTQYTPEARRLWHRWLVAHFRNIGAVNHEYGASFSALDRVPLPASEEDARFGRPQAAYADFVRALDSWFFDAYRRCRSIWHQASGRDDVPFILQFSGFDAEKLAKGRPGLAAFDLPSWIANADAVGLSLYSNGGYPDLGHASIVATVRVLALARELGKDVFVLEVGYENPAALVDAEEFAFLAEAPAALAPRTWIYEFLKEKFNESYASNPGKVVGADGALREDAAAAVRQAFARLRDAPPEEPRLRVTVDAPSLRTDRDVALAANALYALASLVAIRWTAPGTAATAGQGVPLVRLAHVGGPADPLTALLLAVPEPGTDEREAWMRAVAARLATGRGGGHE